MYGAWDWKELNCESILNIFFSDYPNKNNGIFKLGVGFFLWTNLDLLTSHF